MDVLFLKLFNMSIAAGWLIMAVIVLRLLLKKAPRWQSCVLWAIVAVRLVCPLSFESVFSLIPSAETINISAVQYSDAPLIDTGIPVVNGALNPVIGSAAAANAEESVNMLHIWSSIGGIVWAIGLAVLLGYMVFSCLQVHRTVEEAVLYRDNIYICDAVKSPFILGLFRPRIYLPSDVEETQIKYVLAHEQAHLKRKDHWWKPLGHMLLAVYWFNPLMWIAYVLLCRDIELACDEKAIHSLNMDGKKAYSEALVACSMQRRMVMACPLAFGEVGVKERVKTVLNYKKPAILMMVLAAAACIIVAICFLTNPRSNVGLEELIANKKEELTNEIGNMISEAEAVRYSVTDWELIVDHIEGERADCYFGANWISSRKPEDDPMIQGMYQTAQNLTDEVQMAFAMDIVEDWLTEMRSWPEEEYLEQHVVIMRENGALALYYPFIMDGEETLISLKKYVEENWAEDAAARYQSGIDIINEALSLEAANETARQEADNADISGQNYFYLKGTGDNSLILDMVEWVSDDERAAQLGLSEDDMVGGFCIYNEEELLVECLFAEECTFSMLDWYNNYEKKDIDRQGFLDIINDRGDMMSAIPLIIEISDGKIVSVAEQYVP